MNSCAEHLMMRTGVQAKWVKTMCLCVHIVMTSRTPIRM
jgi:hypothetical protein